MCMHIGLNGQRAAWYKLITAGTNASNLPRIINYSDVFQVKSDTPGIDSFTTKLIDRISFTRNIAPQTQTSRCQSIGWDNTVFRAQYLFLSGVD